MAKMNTEELILNFSTQMKDLMKEISEYEQKLNTAKERYLKLQGAVEGLNILQDQSAPAPTTEEEAPERELLNES
jgi:flagellar biosynthesis chaperone FliJ|tara:strand:- start:178 stop:402 length:225 start_codon:yes stop_codon:yes gene_type:complete